MSEGEILRRATTLAVALTQLYDRIERKSYLKNQLARAGTSIGANIYEAQYAQSRADFISKMQIALKECHETEYWLLVLRKAAPEHDEESTRLRQEAGSIRRLLIASLNTAKSCSGE